MTDPLTEPRPPMTRVVIMLKACVKKKDFGEKEVMKCAQRAPATPVRKALIQKASSRDRITLMPSERAAISLSRTALMSRPKGDLPILLTR